MTNPAHRFDNIELSLIRQITALATPDSIDLSLGEPNIEPDEHFRELARRAAGEGSWRYTPNAGSLTLRETIVRAEQLDLDPRSEVCVTAGTQEGLFAVMQAFIDPGDEVLVPDPGFLAYPVLVQLAGGVPRTYKLDPESWQTGVEELHIGPKTKAIIVNSPSNPTGGVESRETLEAITRLAGQRDLLVISDEVYREIYYQERPHSLAGHAGNVIVAGGMSKSHSMTGLRLGWLLARKELMAPILKAHQYIATCASAFSQRLAELVLEEPEWNQTWLQKVRAQFARQRKVALTAIERHLGVKIQPPPGAFYAFVPVPSCNTVSLARTLATEARVLTVPGVAFGAAGEGFLRISWAAAPEAIETGIRNVGRCFDELGW